jgi:hypothetical protein
VNVGTRTTPGSSWLVPPVELIDRLDVVRAELSDLRFLMPVGEPYDLLREAADRIAMAQDLIEEEE